MFEEEKSKAFIKSCYEKIHDRLTLAKERLNRPLTLAEKILFSHLSDLKTFQGDEEFLMLSPDRAIMQDVTAQNGFIAVYADWQKFC